VILAESGAGTATIAGSPHVTLAESGKGTESLAVSAEWQAPEGERVFRLKCCSGFMFDTGEWWQVAHTNQCRSKWQPWIGKGALVR
jgi:hypothetical protein